MYSKRKKWKYSCSKSRFFFSNLNSCKLSLLPNELYSYVSEVKVIILLQMTALNVIFTFERTLCSGNRCYGDIFRSVSFYYAFRQFRSAHGPLCFSWSIGGDVLGFHSTHLHHSCVAIAVRGLVCWRGKLWRWKWFHSGFLFPLLL